MTDVLKYFQEIDQLQFEVFDIIDEILDLKNVSISESESLESRRTTLCRSANKQINKIPDLLKVIETQIRQVGPDEAAMNLLQEKRALYEAKVRHLKLKLKDTQLAAHKMENELIHTQRIEKYATEESTLGTRDDLFAGRTRTQASDDRPVEDQVLTQNKNITSSLKLTKQLMTMSVMQTELNIDTVDQQSKDLTNLNDKLIDLGSVLTKSRQIVKFIEKQDKHDKRRIYASLGFLLLVSAWVIWRRVLKLPVKIMLWTLMKVFGVVSWVSSKPVLNKPEIYATVVPEPISSMWLEAPGSIISTVEASNAETKLSMTVELVETRAETHTESTINTDEAYIQEVEHASFESWEEVPVETLLSEEVQEHVVEPELPRIVDEL